MGDDLANEIKQLRRAVEDLTQRVAALEQSKQQSLTPDISPAKIKETASSEPKAVKQSLEARIGLYWLNLFGVGLLVLGFASLILYSFQYFSAFAKIATGFAIGGAMMLAGAQWLTHKKHTTWLGSNLTVGGWALIYFTTYAMQHFKSVKIIDSALLDICFLFFETAIAAAASYDARRKGNIVTARAHLFAALSLINVTLPLIDGINHELVSVIWTLEVPILVSTGLRLNLRTLRWFAPILTVATVIRILAMDIMDPLIVPIGIWNIEWQQFIGYFAAFCFAVAGCYCRLPAFHANQGRFEQGSFNYAYFAMSALFAAITPFNYDNESVLGTLWSLEGLIFLIVGLWLASRYIRVIGAFFYFFSFLQAIIDIDHYDHLWIALIPTSSFLLATFIYKQLPKWVPHNQHKSAALMRGCYTFAFAILLTELLSFRLPDEYVSLSWALEGLALLVSGFKWNDKYFRVAGLFVFGILLLKLLFVDFAHAEFIYRVISFIAAGIIILMGNYAYVRFAPKLITEEKK